MTGSLHGFRMVASHSQVHELLVYPLRESDSLGSLQNRRKSPEGLWQVSPYASFSRAKSHVYSGTFSGKGVGLPLAQSDTPGV